MIRIAANDAQALQDNQIASGEQQFRRLLDVLPAGAYTCDVNGLITYYNQHAVELWGRVPELNSPVDRYCGSFRLYSSDGKALSHDRCWMALALRTGRCYNAEEIVIERPDGSRLTVLAHANPVYDDQGCLIGCVNVLVNITDRKNAEEALAEAGRQKDEFIATLAHELRNPLSPIRSAVEFLNLHGPVDPDLQWARDVIDRQVGHMVRLIDDLLDVSRITRQSLKLDMQRIRLGEIVEAAVEVSRPQFAERDQALELSVDEQVYVNADRVRLPQVIANLLNNASKYTGRGGHIWLSAWPVEGEVVVRVRDDGVGIEPKMLTRIFDMFAQAEQSLDRVRDGLGIGLTLARQLVELHGGSVDAISAGPGHGSEFVVRLPAAETGSVADCTPGQRRDRTPIDVSSLRVLVVDDNNDSTTALALLLQRMGNAVRTASSGPEALRVADEFRPDTVLLDIGLPGISGYEVARQMRQTPWGGQARLIATTGWGQEEDRRRAAESGFDHHLLKPIDIESLLELLAVRAASESG